METAYLDKEPTRAEVDGWSGATLLEFGAPWCGWCRGAQPKIAQALQPLASVRHVKVEDGSGRRLGRSFGIKLWPTLVMLQDGREVARVVRPTSASAITDALALLDDGPPP